MHLVGNIPILGRCTSDPTGSTDATFTNSTSMVSFVSGDLPLANITGSGCGVMGISSAQHWSIASDYGVSPPQTITLS
jgi:hypothetical protein